MVQPETPDDVGSAPSAATRWGVVALAAVAVLTLLGGAAALVLGRLGGSAPVDDDRAVGEGAASGKRAVACIQVGTGDSDRDYCQRYAEDLIRRTEVTQEQRDRLAEEVRKVEFAVRLPSFCADLRRDAPSGSFVECAGLPTTVRSDPAPPARSRPAGGGSAPAARADREPQPSDADAIRVSLERAGFPGGTVRIARADDPAPHGTIVFGVPVADICFGGYVTLARSGGYGLQGRLPDGRCLSA